MNSVGSRIGDVAKFGQQIEKIQSQYGEIGQQMSIWQMGNWMALSL